MSPTPVTKIGAHVDQTDPLAGPDARRHQRGTEASGGVEQPGVRQPDGTVDDRRHCQLPVVAGPGGYPGVCTGLKPTLSCVWANDDGTYSAALGFTNPSQYTIEADAGSYQNSVYLNGSTPHADGQPSFFRPGDPVTEFTLDWNPLQGNDVQWALDGTTLRFSSSSGPACAQHPVPIMGSMTVLGIVAFGGVGAFVFFNRRSIARKEWLRRLVHAG